MLQNVLFNRHPEPLDYIRPHWGAWEHPAAVSPGHNDLWFLVPCCHPGQLFKTCFQPCWDYRSSWLPSPLILLTLPRAFDLCLAPRLWKLQQLCTILHKWNRGQQRCLVLACMSRLYPCCLRNSVPLLKACTPTVKYYQCPSLAPLPPIPCCSAGAGRGGEPLQARHAAPVWVLQQGGHTHARGTGAV
jgi:hypothetical protein